MKLPSMKIKGKLFFYVSCVVLAFVVVLILLLSTTFDSYVRSQKKKEILKIYNQLNQAEVCQLNSTEYIMEIEMESNIRLSLRDTNFTPVYQQPFSPMDRFFPHIKDIASGEYTFLEAPKKADFQAINFIGKFDNGYYMTCQIPFSYVHENMQYTIMFIVYAGIIALCLCFFISYYLAKKISDPIVEIDKVTAKMADLDFSEKCTYNSDDELGHLSGNVNFLSEELERNITSLQQEIENERKIDEMRKNLIINVSHELKTPIFLIQSYAEGLKANIADSQQDRDYYCDVITDESLRMDKMVKELLSLAKLEAGKQQLHLSPFSMQEMVDKLLKSTKISLESKQICVQVHLHPDTVYGDKDMLEQAVRNLLINAIDFTQNHGIIKLYSTVEDGKYLLHVYNSGSHIPEEELEKLWQNFYRVDKSRNRAYGGTGIGLSIVKAVMDSHKNGYGVVNKDDGVEFTIVLDLEALHAE